MIKTTKRQDQMHLPSRSNSLFLIPKAGNRVLIRSDPIRLQNNFIRSDPKWSYLIRNPKKSDRIGSDSDWFRIGFAHLYPRGSRAFGASWANSCPLPPKFLSPYAYAHRIVLVGKTFDELLKQALSAYFSNQINKEGNWILNSVVKNIETETECPITSTFWKTSGEKPGILFN